MSATKIEAGAAFPEMLARDLDGNRVDIGKPADSEKWKMIVVYRGWHCPICTQYLNELEHYKQDLADAGVEVVAVSADTQSQLEEYKEKLDVSYPLYWGLSIEQLQQLGLYISHPRSEQETDHPFPEPGLFVINENGQAHVVDIANNPFVRPNLERLVSGLKWIKDPQNNYPIRGTYK